MSNLNGYGKKFVKLEATMRDNSSKKMVSSREIDNKITPQTGRLLRISDVCKDVGL